MSPEELREKFAPAIQEIIDTCRITDEFVDKDRFRVVISTIWGNAVLSPERSGIEESDLEDLHSVINDEIENILGTGETLTTCFEFLMSKAGEEAMARLQIRQQHREFIAYFGRLILGPGIEDIARQLDNNDKDQA